MGFAYERAHEFPRATGTKSHRLGGLKQHTLILAVVEARNLELRCGAGGFCLQIREDPFHPSLPGAGDNQHSGVACPTEASLLCLTWLPLCVCLHVFMFL